MEQIQTIDAGEVEVQLSPVGQFLGSNAKGEPIEENITSESLERLAETLNATGQEVLCDVDHASCRPGADKDSKAAGWFSNFKTTVKGLFATLKLTEMGRKLVQTRAFRFLSPVFALDANGEPADLHSAALTNTPAFRGFIQPILNAEPDEISKEDILQMTKEELVELVKETVLAMNAAPEVKEPEKEEKTEEAKEPETVESACSEKTAENACSEEVKNEETEEKPDEVTDTAEAKEDDVVEPDKTEAAEQPAKCEDSEPKKEEEKDEVIKIESLNSAPTLGVDVSGKCEWEGLHGKQFFDWLSKNNKLYK